MNDNCNVSVHIVQFLSVNKKNIKKKLFGTDQDCYETFKKKRK